MAVQSVVPAELAWVADPDPGASLILAHHHPTVPNLGDIRTVDWSQVEPVDILTAGFPCQPISAAGHGAGIHDDRWLFDDITRAIGNMATRPRLCLFENVPRLLSIGGGNAMASVVHGLAALGYMGSWRTLRASAVGAAHQRERVFIVAYTANQRHERRRAAWNGRSGLADSGISSTDTQGAGWPGMRSEPSGDRSERSHPATTDAQSHRWNQGWPEPARIQRRSDTPVAGSADRWGKYAAAIARWEHITGRPAPSATHAGRNGQRLTPRFVEFLMGLPAGHVTDVPGLSRNQQLHALGNGVVPQQGAAAFAMLLEHAA